MIASMKRQRYPCYCPQQSVPQPLSRAALLGIGMVFAGCCSNVFFLELIIKEAPSSGNIVTFFQFLFIALHGFVTTARFGAVKPVIPLSYYALMVSMFFMVQVINNYALNFNISMPLHMIFRSGSLMANLVLGILLLKKSYPMSKYLSVLVITIGIVVCTIESASDLHRPPTDDGEAGAATEQLELFRWCIGVLMLVFALFMSARMGIFQEETYRKHGKHPDESLFYNHCLPLPGFLLLSADIWRHVRLFSESAPLLPWLPVPRLWLWLAGNVITQYLCIRGVFVLTTECSSLAVTLVVTLRKFTSLLFSIFYFNNRFSGMHWLGTACVFGGTLVFTETHQRLLAFAAPRRGKRD